MKRELNTESYVDILKNRKRKTDLIYKHKIIARFLHSYIPEKDRSVYFDLTAGVGNSFEVINFYYPFKKYILNDCDIKCMREIRKKAKYTNVKITCQDSFKMVEDGASLVFLDLNTFTLKMKDLVRKFIDFIRMNNPKYVMFTDTASFYFRILPEGGEKPYQARTYNDYVKRWNKIFQILKYKQVADERYKNKKVSVFLYKRR